MSRVSLPGLALSAVVVVAALLALLALDSGGSAPGQYESPPETDAIMRLSEARGAVKGRQATSEAERRRATQTAAGAQRRARNATRRARAARANGRNAGAQRRVNRAGRRGASRRGSSQRGTRRGATRRGNSGRGRSGLGNQTPVSSPPASNPGYATETEYTRVYVRRLRNKLEDPDGPPLIVNEPRAGYRFVAVPSDPPPT